jgi:hypothetical protein
MVSSPTTTLGRKSGFHPFKNFSNFSMNGHFPD